MDSGKTEQTIHKYRLGRDNNTPVSVLMPKDAHVLHVDYDPTTSEICVWAVVLLAKNGEYENRTFYVAGTGHDLGLNLTGNEQMLQLNSFHVFREAISGWFHGFEVRDDE